MNGIADVHAVVKEITGLPRLMTYGLVLKNSLKREEKAIQDIAQNTNGSVVSQKNTLLAATEALFVTMTKNWIEPIF